MVLQRCDLSPFGPKSPCLFVPALVIRCELPLGKGVTLGKQGCDLALCSWGSPSKICPLRAVHWRIPISWGKKYFLEEGSGCIIYGTSYVPKGRSYIPSMYHLQFSSVTQSCPAFETPWTAVCQASLSITNSRSLLKLMSIELVMPSNHLILCHPILLPPSIFPSIRVFSSVITVYQNKKFHFIIWKSFLPEIWPPSCYFFLSLIASPVIQLANLKTSESHLTSSPNLCHSATRGISVSSLHIHHSVCSGIHCFSFLMTSP